MKWNSQLLEDLKWSSEISNLEAKRKIGEKIASMVEDGHVLGVGSGSSVYVALFTIAEKLKAQGLNVKAIPTSHEIALTCANLGFEVTSLNEYAPDILFDGADEVGPNNALIKGRGGAMFKEKLIMRACKHNFILADASKMVDQLGSKFAIPVEVFPQALVHVEQSLLQLSAKKIELRMAKGKDGPIITESNNLILDVQFEQIGDSLEKDIKGITGVIESGLFQNFELTILSS